MRAGVTGTRDGMSRPQKIAAANLLDHIQMDELHHGDCIGVDYEMHQLAVAREIPVVIHPPHQTRFRAWCESDRVEPPLPYLLRNHNIVDRVELLLAFPNGMERLHSGTWATIRYARKHGIVTVVVSPDGSEDWQA